MGYRTNEKDCYIIVNNNLKNLLLNKKYNKERQLCNNLLFTENTNKSILQSKKRSEGNI